MNTQLVTGLGVHLKVASIERSREFYEGELGLTAAFAYGDVEFLGTIPAGTPTAPENYRGVTYEIPGGAKIEIADGHIAVKNSSVFAESLQSPKVSAMLNVTSLVPIVTRGVLQSNSSLKKYYWGTIEMVVRDPDGWVIVLIAPFSEAELEALQPLTTVEEILPQSG